MLLGPPNATNIFMYQSTYSIRGKLTILTTLDFSNLPSIPRGNSSIYVTTQTQYIEDLICVDTTMRIPTTYYLLLSARDLASTSLYCAS